MNRNACNAIASNAQSSSGLIDLEETARRSIKKQNKARFLRSRSMYLMLIPGIAFVLVFNYLPMYGILIGFEEYNIFLGSSPIEAISLSNWVGLRNWTVLWTQAKFKQAIINTFIISFMKVCIAFPIPILLALMINEVRAVIMKRTLQTVMYLPHFMSWVVVGALFMNLLGTAGIVNRIIVSCGGDIQTFFMDNRWFRWVILITAVWKESGWNTIVYLAAITSIDPSLYEAAKIDGATKIKQIRHVTLPCIAGTIIMMLILRLGGIMDAGFSQILVMYNPTVYKSGDIIGTYIYREGLGKLNWSEGTVVGIFNSVINLILVLGGNYLSKLWTERSIW